MSDQILSKIEATVSDIQAITNALVYHSTPAAEPEPKHNWHRNEQRLAEEMCKYLEEKADQLEVDCGPPEPCHDDQFPEIKIHPAADIDPIGTDAKAIREQMQRVDNDVNGNPRYVLHFLAFDNDYATAKEIANSLGWSVYRAKSHGGCFVGQSYSTEADAHYIAKAKARHAEAKGGAQ